MPQGELLFLFHDSSCVCWVCRFYFDCALLLEGVLLRLQTYHIILYRQKYIPSMDIASFVATPTDHCDTFAPTISSSSVATARLAVSQLSIADFSHWLS
jgi:hypothetical protein